MKYTVLLLRPDYVTSDYGIDTYMDHVVAPTAEAAVDKARLCVIGMDGRTLADRDDYRVLAVFRGHHHDITPEDKR